MNLPLVLLTLSILFYCDSLAQNIAQPAKYLPNRYQSDSIIRMVFWNVENFFDTLDDPATEDEDFTPDGERKWSSYRYWQKRNNITKTLWNIGTWCPPEIIAIAEVENRKICEDLIDKPPLNKVTYKIIHEESRDRRGIDIAMLYQPDKFELIDYSCLQIPFQDSLFISRDILYVVGNTPQKDTLHIFVNHWPSRYGGRAATSNYRNEAALFLKKLADSLQHMNQPNIIITGDFNDYPDDESIYLKLGANSTKDTIKDGKLYNLMAFTDIRFGTHSFQGKWGNLDQWIVSGYLLNNYLVSGYIYNMDWLLKTNSTGGTTTNRTYQGPAWKGGYSDHLPIVLDLKRHQ